MTNTNQAMELPVQTRAVLHRKAWTAEGQMEAFRFVLNNTGGILELQTKLQEVEELLADASMAAGPMAPSAGPRIYREGYAAGLREAIAIIKEHQLSN